MEQGLFFPYSWHLDELEQDVTSIRVYGLDIQNRNVCLRIDDFHPYIYIELPATSSFHKNIQWNTVKAQLVGNEIDKILQNRRPLRKELVWMKRLYGAHINPKTMKRKLFPYLLCRFSHQGDIKPLWFKLRKRNICIPTLGGLKLKIHESDADPILQLTCRRNIPTAGWVKFYGIAVNNDQKITLCDYEFKVKSKYLEPYQNDIIPKPKIMGFDIEVNSSIPTAMPNSGRADDKIFQVSCVLSREGDKPEDYERYILSLGEPDQKTTGNDVIIYTYDTESDLLMGFTQFIREENPNLIVGYNILGFDIPYMIARARREACIMDFDQQGFHKYAHAPLRTIKWSSSAYKNQEFAFLDAEGRLYVDLLPIVKRDFKFNNYKLKTISEYFIGQTKDPLSVKGIFKCYRIGVKKNEHNRYGIKARKAMGIVGKYCVQDSVLVVKLVDKLKTWVGLAEMAKTCNVPIFTLYTQGQQIKVYSQLYKHCMSKNIVVEKNGYQTLGNERYVGAKVFPPIPGRYKMVVPFDFASLYPTTIIAYNIDYHTWVPPGSDIPDHKCHVMEWEDHQACIHDPKVIRKVKLTKYINQQQENIKRIGEKRNKTTCKSHKKELMAEIKTELVKLKPYREERAELNKTIPKVIMCSKRKYRFLKEPQGVMPTVIQNLLDARKYTRKVDMVACRKEIERLQIDATKNNCNNSELILAQRSLLDVLNKRQLAYKVSANSMYGAMGVRRGYLPFMPGAMCTTYMGRVNIEIVARTIPEKFGGKLIYGDTDSNYIYFPHFKTAQETWDYAIKVAQEVTKLFPSPIQLEFEEEIYAYFFILSKKRYMYRKCLRDGVIEDKIGRKGVLLARRDNSQFVRDIYEVVIGKIFDNQSSSDIILFILKEINDMCSGNKPYTDFIVTKSIGNPGGLQAVSFTNEKGIKKAKVGDYTVPLLSSNEEERRSQMMKKGALTAQEYYLRCLPAQVQLAEKMRQRGQRVDVGSRLEYIIAKPECHTAKQYEKLESADYLAKHQDLVKIDYMYYLKALVNPLDQVLDVAFKNEKGFKMGFVMQQYTYRLKVRGKVLNELLELFRPSLIFKDD